MTRRRAVAGAPIGMVHANARGQFDRLTDAEFAEVASALKIGAEEASALPGQHLGTLRHDLEYALNAYATELTQSPALPTEREVATDLSADLATIGGITADIIQAVELVTGAQGRLLGVIEQLATRTPAMSRAALELHAKLRDAIDGPKKLLEISDAVHDLALGVRNEAGRLEENTRDRRDRALHATLKFFRTIRGRP